MFRKANQPWPILKLEIVYVHEHKMNAKIDNTLKPQHYSNSVYVQNGLGFFHSLQSLTYLFKLYHKEWKGNCHTNSLKLGIECLSSGLNLITCRLIGNYFWFSSISLDKNYSIIKVTFSIIFRPNVKYPAAVRVGHWWCIWIVSFWTWRSNLGDPSTVDIWQMVMKGCFDYKIL